MILGLGTNTLETDRLVLRRFKVSDAKSAFANWSSDPNVTRYLKWNAHKHLQHTTDVFKNWIDEYHSPYYYHWAITLKDSAEVIGGINLEVKDRYDECGELGYSLGSPFWRQGYAREAASAVLRYAFVNVGFNRIEGMCAEQNAASAGLLTALGMEYEGTLRSFCRISSGEFCDCRLYSILCQDYFDRYPEHFAFELSK